LFDYRPDTTTRFPRVLLHLGGTVAFGLLGFALVLPGAAAKAPPHATTYVPVTLLTAPSYDAEVVGEVPAGTELELTGEAAPDFIEVVSGDGVAWAPAHDLSLGVSPGIDTAVTAAETPLLEAPLPDAGVVAVVPGGETVILTGAHVDGYDAASHDRVGGWIDAMDLVR
jgi:Bacterial SH3 domain